MALRTNPPLRQCLRLVSQVERHRTSFTSSYTRPAIPIRIAGELSPVRPLSTSIPRQKKRKIAPASNSPPPSSSGSSTPSSSGNDTAPPSSSSSSSSKGVKPNPEDPLDFSSVTAAFAPIDAHFKSQLQGLIHGGRFNPDNLGALPVSVKSDDPSGGHESFPLRELAQVVPRPGRTISLLVHDKAYIKPIMSAVQASPDYNQQPQRSEDNDLELLLKVELERKEDSQRRVKDVTQAWRERVRQARAKHDKVLKDWKKKGTVISDVFHKAEKELQKVQDKKMKEIDAEEAKTLKQL